ncbi:conserved hypothetical protein [Ricinus communis]|uniref:Uncharacterized protein n=1 Tax=Ricinus communis TaxID=3988 RepID=B9RX68_RICCO|nr:conserved hypothetical protein [Ricinus communis]
MTSATRMRNDIDDDTYRQHRRVTSVMLMTEQCCHETSKEVGDGMDWWWVEVAWELNGEDKSGGVFF